jgi:hypothetical protein
MKQWQRLLEIQEMQTDLMGEILENRSVNKESDDKKKRK